MTTSGFHAFCLSQDLQKALQDMGFTQPSPIQTDTIPYLLDGRDVIGQAQTGTGKTAAFGVPLIEGIHGQNKKIQALVLCPTRELALQVTEELTKLAKYKKSVQVAAIYGGQPIERQFRLLSRRPQVIVGTPGRVQDHIRRGTLRLDAVRTFVLDEADEMLNMGFRDDIERILKEVPKVRQTVFFSATMPPPILELTRRYQQNPQHIKAVNHDQAVPKIDQRYIEVQGGRRKTAALVHLMQSHRYNLALVFCNTKRGVDRLVQSLVAEGYEADGLHGGMSQSKRDKVMQRFRRGTTRLLVATDVAARGLDVDNIEAVFNYDIPNDVEFYIHRIGRTGRAGKAGCAFTFVDQGQFGLLRRIGKSANVRLSKEELPALA